MCFHKPSFLPRCCLYNLHWPYAASRYLACSFVLEDDSPLNACNASKIRTMHQGLGKLTKNGGTMYTKSAHKERWLRR